MTNVGLAKRAESHFLSTQLRWRTALLSTAVSAGEEASLGRRHGGQVQNRLEEVGHLAADGAAIGEALLRMLEAVVVPAGEELVGGAEHEYVNLSSIKESMSRGAPARLGYGCC